MPGSGQGTDDQSREPLDGGGQVGRERDALEPGQPVGPAGRAMTRRSLDLRSLSAAYTEGSVTPEAVMVEVLARIAAAGSDAVWISRVPDADLLAQARALTEPSLPLYGVPFAVKDNIDVAGLPTMAGCPAYAYTPPRHAAVVQRLVDAGAIPVGKTIALSFTHPTWANPLVLIAVLCSLPGSAQLPPR